MRVKKNDTVLILTGKDSGKTGKVLRSVPDDNAIVVDGINVQKKHKKARSARDTSGIINQAGPIDASNVLVICPVCGKATRVAYLIEDDKKTRICKKCGKALDTKAEAKKPAKKAAKGDATAKTEKAPKKKSKAEKA